MAKWQMILFEFDIVFTTQKVVKGQAIADHLAENPRDDDYQPLHTYFPDEKILFIGAIEDMSEQHPGWRLFFDGASNSLGAEIGAVLVSPEGKHYPVTAKLRFPCTNNMAEYEAFWPANSGIWKHIPRTRNAFADALATLFSMIQHPDELNRPAHCLVTERVIDGRSWYNDIKEFMKTGSYPPDADAVAKNFLHRMSARFFLNGEVLYKKTSDLGLLRGINEEEADYMMKEVHSGVCGSHMNGHLLAKKIMRT
ncbi:uncharacterized protein [Coffea arabica]|uniref:RNase H type-1 domain-containing protein n=1 Tax=Coffea arabica TaxID=13443 RepID=A0ABM4VGZ9_COFAR